MGYSLHRCCIPTQSLPGKKTVPSDGLLSVNREAQRKEHILNHEIHAVEEEFVSNFIRVWEAYEGYGCSAAYAFELAELTMATGQEIHQHPEHLAAWVDENHAEFKTAFDTAHVTYNEGIATWIVDCMAYFAFYCWHVNRREVQEHFRYKCWQQCCALLCLHLPEDLKDILEHLCRICYRPMAEVSPRTPRACEKYRFSR